MLAKHCSFEDLQKALEIVNKKFDNNVIFNRIEPAGKHIRFTLRVKDSKEAGHRRGFCSVNGKQPKRLTSACWHVHGEFFDALLLEVNPNTVIVARGGQIYRQLYNSYVTGNWEDSNIGSMYNPLYFSDACDCNNQN